VVGVSRLRRLAAPRPEPESIDRWSRGVDRLRRSITRYQEQVIQISDRALRAELHHIGEGLDTALVDVVSAGDRSQVRAGRDEVALRSVGGAATLVAHATEVAMMAGDAAWHREHADVGRCLDTVRTLVKAVGELADACNPPSHP
jgi:hypothetical protein